MSGLWGRRQGTIVVVLGKAKFAYTQLNFVLFLNKINV